MVRRLLLILTLAGMGAACTSLQDPERAALDPDHGELACRACHDGEAVNGRLPDVPGRTCSSADCHRSDNPAVVTLETVEFEHRGHASTEEMPLGCAGCHTHDAGVEPLRAEEESCALCHREEMSGAAVSDCMTCHTGTARAFTSQGLAVPHEDRSWISSDCVRCHYDVAAIDEEVEVATCNDCHRDDEAAIREGIGDDLHPAHTGVSCSSCHREDTHRIMAMSSSVRLDCTGCHTGAHDLTLAEEPFGAADCNACHETEHRAEQGLLLGLVPHAPVAAPGEKFADGVTCRSCHVRTPGAEDPLAGSGAGCTGCHRPEYATVLEWWKEGIAERHDLTERYLTTAERRLRSSGASSAVLLRQARDWVETLEEASGVHNLGLTHRLLARALERSGDAYAVAGVSAPAPPELGREPRSGLCSYCHYRPGETTITAQMDTVFHREVLGIGR